MKNLKIFSSGIAMLLLFGSFDLKTNLLQTTEIEKVITGTVSDVSGLPLPGATVSIKGSQLGTQTDFDGKYRIKAKENQILVFSFVGMKTTEMTIGKKNTINVTLQDDSMQLESVVVTATGIRREKRSLGYAVQNSSSKDKVSKRLSGKVAGVQISNASPSQNIVIRSNKSYKNEELKSGKIYGNVIPASPSDEDYDSFVENPFETPKNAPLSTFSIDVDNASYTNVRRFINNGQNVPADAVRVEEMINFFKYKYPQPLNSNPFSINTEYSESPWNPKHKLLRIGLQGKNIPTDDLPASNLVFLIDVSGSMSDDNKLPLLKQSLKILVQELRKEDKVAIVVYAGAAGLVLPPTSGSEKKMIIDALENLQAGGSTAGGAGIDLAYKTAEENFIKNGNNRVILATDGDFNVGNSSNKDMETLITEKRKSGVFLTCLGYGMGNYKDSKMEILSDKGNGNYAYIDNIQEANRFLGKEFKGSMFAIAKDVKIQIEFNPKQVQAYRLIGYENRKLRPEDFTNDKIDAGELGSGHTVTALYEIVPVGVSSDFTGNIPELKYTKTEATLDNSYKDELATVKFRYKKPNGDKSTEMVQAIKNTPSLLQNATDDFKFSAAVAWFGLKLRDSKLIGNKNSGDIEKLARQGLSNDADGYKAEFIRLVESEVKI